MTEDSNGEKVYYHMDISKRMGRKIKRMLHQAKGKGVFQLAVAAMETIEQRLQNDPNYFGEIIQTLPHMNLSIHVAFVRRVRIYFGIHKTKPIVFVKDVLLVHTA